MTTYQFYKGSTLRLVFKTAVPPAGEQRSALSQFDIQVKAQGYSAQITEIDDYSVEAVFSAATTSKLKSGAFDLVIFLTKQERTAVGKASGLVAVEPSFGAEIPEQAEPIEGGITIDAGDYAVNLNNLFGYDDFTEADKLDILQGIQAQADQLFDTLTLQVGGFEDRADEAIAAANAAAQAALGINASVSEAEGLRIIAEAARAEAEGDSSKGRVKAEADRVIAEAARAEAEGDNSKGRVKAEIDRVVAEIARNEAEGDATKGRVKAEIGRVVAEEIREGQEQGRVAAENARITAGAVIQTQIANTLTETASGKVLDARQGKVLNDGVYNTEEVTAQSLVDLKERVDALEELIKQGILNNIIIKTLSVEDFQMNGASLILTGANAPAVTPDFIGQFYIKTTATTACYQSTGTTAVGDWKQIG